MNNKKRVFFLDTNMIRNKRFLSFLGGRDLLNHISKKGDILIPNMVLREIEKQKKDNFEKEKKELNYSNVEECIKSLKENEKIEFKDIKINNESKAFQDIQDLAVNIDPPFNKINKCKDVGFKDAVIYITIKEWVEENSSNGEHYIYFLSKDKYLRKALRGFNGAKIKCLSEPVWVDCAKKKHNFIIEEIEKTIEEEKNDEKIICLFEEKINMGSVK